MDKPEKPDITTGKQPEPTPILADGKGSTAASSRPAPAKNENASIEIASILALLQTDFSDLQSKGLKISILARGNRLYASIAWEGHSIGVSDTGARKHFRPVKVITLDDKPVTEYE